MATFHHLEATMRQGTRLKFIIGAVLVVIVVLPIVNYFRPVPAVAAHMTLSGLGGGDQPSVSWPSGAQSAIGAVGAGVLSASPNQRPRPIASVAKVMTALAVLEAKPLQKGNAGPSLTISADDVTLYNKAKADGESVVAVQVGEQLSELQALQGLLIPSGNNMADLLARWAYGSTGAALQWMNQKAKSLGMARSTFTDVSGLDPGTVSVPADLVLLGETAMANEVLAGIVAQPQADLPVAGTVYNVNYKLGVDGIDGIKTGTAPEAGACYLFSAPQPAGGTNVTIVGAVMGLPTIDLAFQGGRSLLAAVRQSVQVRSVVTKGQAVGRYDAPWGSSSVVAALEDLAVPVFPGERVAARLEAPSLDPPAAPGTKVGSLVVEVGMNGHVSKHLVPIATQGSLDEPGAFWRLTRTG